MSMKPKGSLMMLAYAMAATGDPFAEHEHKTTPRQRVFKNCLNKKCGKQFDTYFTTEIFCCLACKKQYADDNKQKGNNKKKFKNLSRKQRKKKQ